MKARIFKSISTKLIFVLVFSSLMLGIIISALSYMITWNTYSKFFSNTTENAVRFAATLVDGDVIGSYLETGKKDEYYKELNQILNNMKREANLMYLYIFQPHESSFTYIMEAKLDTDNLDNISNLGDVYEYTDLEYKYFINDWKAKKESDQLILGGDDRFGNTVSAWAPIFDSEGNVTAYVEGDYSLSEVKALLNKFIFLIMLVVSGVTIITTSFMIYANKKIIISPLGQLTSNALEFASGENLKVLKNSITTGDEMEELSVAFEKMAVDIGEYMINISKITAEKERIDAELDIATKIQASMLPSTFPAFPNRSEFDIYASMIPAKEVGGDFYDFFMIDQRHLGLVIADVSGKGVPAALFMMITKTLIKNNAQYGNKPKEIFETVNNQLCEGNEADMFVTAFMGILDIDSRKFTYVNAGHNPPLIKRSDKDYEWLKTKPGFVLAGMEDIPYKQDEIILEPGDTLYMYTDGVTEATNTENQLFSDSRLKDVLNENKDVNLEKLLYNVKKEIDLFVKEAPQFDDITMLAIKVN
ncbi:MAG: SpoIIE family protein phosphatase [Tissierellia bacterium]|nr:SpoIIE family protein phosphatase [Tissierellia bacterium]MDD4726622.1 SpoIIE family protein phosphatase [Tissierellia bacterium]